MRGVVTLAAAAGIPSSFPHRDVIQALAFVVAAGTLLVQGSTDDAERETVAERAGSPLREATRTMRRTMLAAQRQALTAARDKGELDEDVTRRELERLDYEEAAAWWSSTIDE